MAARVNNFGLKYVVKDPQPYIVEYTEIKGYKIYRSNLNKSYFNIQDDGLEVFRVIEYHGVDPVDLIQDLEGYIEYYKKLPDGDKEQHY